MTQPHKLIIKTSPVVFVKRLIFIEFFLALLTTLLSFWFDFSEIYQSLPVARMVSFGLMLGMIITSFQVVIIVIAFITWYTDTYEIDPKKVVRERGHILGTKEIARTPAITGIRVNQSKLGDSLNYGTLILTTSNKNSSLKNIPNPTKYAERIRQLIEPERFDVHRHLQRPTPAMIAEGEGQYLEFKSSFSWDYRRQSINKRLNKAVMKNIVGFLNTTGGVVLMGVGDEGQILGLEQEIQTLGKPNIDGFENVFNTAFNKMIGVEHRHFMKLAFEQIDERTICRILVLPSPEPVFLKEDNQETFYVRTGNSSQPMTMSQAVKYIQSHFEK